MELSEFKKYFRMNFKKKKYFLTTKIPGSVLIRGGHLVNVAQLVSMKGERERTFHSNTFLSVNPIKLLMEVKILRKKCQDSVHLSADLKINKLLSSSPPLPPHSPSKQKMVRTNYPHSFSSFPPQTGIDGF